MIRNLENKVAWITGAGSGIGAGKSETYDPTPVGIASRGVYVGLGVTHPQVRLDVNGGVYCRGGEIFFSMDDNSNANFDYIRSSDSNFKRPGKFFFCHDEHRVSQNGTSILVAGAIQLSDLTGNQQHPSTFP